MAISHCFHNFALVFAGREKEVRPSEGWCPLVQDKTWSYFGFYFSNVVQSKSDCLLQFRRKSQVQLEMRRKSQLEWKLDLQCWKKNGHLKFDFTKTLLTPSISIAQWRAMAYSKACFLSYKMRYHLNLKLLIWGQDVTGKKKHMFLRAAILGKR